MKMNKKILISVIAFIIAVFIFGLIWNAVSSKSKKESKTDTNNINNIDISTDDAVTDECTEEWIEYNKELQDAFMEASGNLTEENTHYIVKSKDGYINIYYINDKNEELLYKRTSIAIDYLSPEDIELLNLGVEIVGNDELNKMLEDFE